jgi:hypothetical protein
MPTGTSCFSNPADLPPIIGNRDAAQSAQSGWLNCFSYPADVPPDIGNRSVVRPVRDSKLCFSYQANAVQPPPDSKLCFSYTVTHRFRY